MTTSDDDKTRIQSKPGSKPESKPKAKPKAPAASENARAQEGAQRASAQKKADELEKRLAAIAAQKKKRSKSAAQTSSQSNAQTPSDKTQIKPRAQASADKTRVKPQSPAADDQTRIQPRDEAPSDQTVFQPRKPVDASHASDKTQILNPSPAQPSKRPQEKPQPPAGGEYAGHELLKNRFVFEKVLGAGGMGVVYKAKDLLKVEAQDKDPYVAIKVLSDEFKTHPEAFIALQRESRKTQRIAHPNIVNVHDFDRDGDTVFMTMEYLEGRPLDKLISQYKATGLPEEDVWKILEGLSAALIYAHEQKIIHSDFKPGNIYITDENSAKVFDFGIARAVAKAEALEESVDDKTVFDAGNLGALTPAYASLEMLEGHTPDVRDDIYALGCIAYEMFTGDHPFNRIHADEAMKRKLKPKRIPNITKAQWRVIEKSLSFKREDRIESVREFWSQLTHKRSSVLVATVVASVLVAALSVIVYQNFFAPNEGRISEDEIRSEIERKVLIEQNKKDLAELLESKEFTQSWERRLQEAYGNLETLLGKDDLWIAEQKTLTFDVYFNKIVSLIAEENFQRARELVESSRAYTQDETRIAAMLSQIDDAEKAVAVRQKSEKEKQAKALAQQKASSQKKQAQKERNQAFDVAFATVKKQLACRSTMNMRDIDIAVDKLRSLNRSRYNKIEGDIVGRLASCISKIGESFPERAEEFKSRALRLFPRNSVIANLKIQPKDPCDVSLAGLGARGSRAICRDSLKSGGDSIGKGPAMVVVPAKGSVSAFAIGKYEVTVGDFNAYCKDSKNCEERSASSPKMPVTSVKAAEIEDYLNWLSRKSKRKYRLPTVAEWSYAARAESSRLDSNRNCRLDSRGIKKGGALIKTTSGQQNPWGLVNYLGNVQELLFDRGAYMVAGGSYETAMEDCVIDKTREHSGKANTLTGFRVLREID